MTRIGQIVDGLKRIIQQESERKETVDELMELLAQDLPCVSKEMSGLLRELAEGLEYYEPNPEWRKGSLMYYGDDILELIAKRTLENLTLK